MRSVGVFVTTVTVGAGVLALSATAVRAGGVPRGGGVRPVPGRSIGIPMGRELLEMRRTAGANRREPSNAAPPSGTRTAPAGPRVRFRTGVRRCALVATAGDLARVHVTLEVENTGTRSGEWRHVGVIDPNAEVIGGSLERQGVSAIVARSLTQGDAERLYAAVRAPPQTARTRPRRGRDPLRIERPAAQGLGIHVWPVAPEETVLVHLTLVIPFGPGPVEALRPLASYPAATIPMDHADPRGDEAVVVPGGGLGTAVAVWRFDPVAFLHRMGRAPRPDERLRLVGARGSTRWIAPHVFRATSEARSVTARVRQHAASVRYAVQVVGADGSVQAVVEQEVPARRAERDPQVTGMVTAWHRAMLARRVLAWAGADPSRRERAVRFAVDLGVLLEGDTCALAIPDDALRRLRPADRRLYRRDGVPLGAQRREAEGRGPPGGALAP